MKRMAILAGVLGLAGCAEFDPNLLFQDKTWENSVETTYMGRTWQVSRNAENLNSIRAVQDNNNLNPFGRPALRKSIQATRAIEQATGCKIIRKTLYKNVSDVFYAVVLCQDKPAS
ncbi:MAG: hypothetical protein JKY94_16330 [Rhodobacteraceae bacterium]|nr:hypothetical protein [Paracoccaceae bacterium]